jgi:hypothetical protein
MLSSKDVIEQSLHYCGLEFGVNCEKVYHYTSLAALKNILLGIDIEYVEFFSRRVESKNDRLNLHCTHTNFLNDPNEILYAWIPMREALCDLVHYYNDMEKADDSLSTSLAPRNLIEELLYRLELSLTKDDVKRQAVVEQYADVYKSFPKSVERIKQYQDGFYSDFYIACFSELDDDLSQWRGYGDNAKGVCIEYDVESLRPNLQRTMQETFLKVVYKNKDEIKETIKSFVRRVVEGISHAPQEYQKEGNSIDAALMFKLFEMLCVFKSPSYGAEKEIRFFVQKVLKDDYSGVSFKERDSHLIPYLSFAYPAYAITKIALGPKANFMNNAMALDMIKKKRGLSFEIQQSKISYR